MNALGILRFMVASHQLSRWLIVTLDTEYLSFSPFIPSSSPSSPFIYPSLLLSLHPLPTPLPPPPPSLPSVCPSLHFPSSPPASTFANRQ